MAHKYHGRTFFLTAKLSFSRQNFLSHCKTFFAVKRLLKCSTIEKENRNIIWFNPPYSKNVKTNVGKIFFKLLHKHFPKSNKLYKIFNRNTVKISYSCMKNLNSILSSHNTLQLKTKHDNNRLCNCRNQESCPLQGQCLTRNIIYQATVKSKGDIKTYIGLSERPFKE